MRNKTVYAIIAIFLIQAFSASLAVIPNQSDTDLFFPESSDTSARNNSSSGGNNSTTSNDAHCLTLDNLTISTTYYVSIDLVNICNTSINYPGINASADDLGVSGLPSSTSWWYMIGPNGTYTTGLQLSFNQSVANNTNITLNFNTWILNCDTNNSWHDCPDSSEFGNMSLQFTYVNTSSNANICGTDPSLTDLFVSIDDSDWTGIPSQVEGNYYVNCSVIGNHYWLEATIWSGSVNTSYFSTSWQENDTYESIFEDWLNLSAGTNCVNVTLWDMTGGSQNYVDNEYPCFTLASSGGNNTGGNNTGGNTGGNDNGSNTNICGTDPSLTDLFVSIDDSDWTGIPSQVEGNYYVNCSVIGNHYWLEATIWSGSVNTSYFSTSWQENDTYESIFEDWLNLSAGTNCVNVTLWDMTGGSQNYVDNEYPCFTLASSGGNNTGGNNTGGNNSNEGNNTGCGSDVNTTGVMAYPPYLNTVDNESVPATMYVDCGIWNSTMMLDYWIYDQNNDTVDSGNYTWNGTPYVFELTWNATGLNAGNYNFHADLYVDGIFVDSDDQGFSVVGSEEGNESNDCANIQCDACPPGMVSDPDGGCCACMEAPETNVDNGSNNTTECTPWNNVECNDEFGCNGDRIPVLAIDEATGEVMLDSDGNQIEVWGCSENSSGEDEGEASEIPSIGVLGTIAAISIGFAIISRKKD